MNIIVFESGAKVAKAISAAIIGFSAIVMIGTVAADAKIKVGVVKYDKKGKVYCEFSDGTFIDPPFTATTNPNGTKSCQAKALSTLPPRVVNESMKKGNQIAPK